jgi:hypothetical protein
VELKRCADTANHNRLDFNGSYNGCSTVILKKLESLFSAAEELKSKHISKVVTHHSQHFGQLQDNPSGL